LKNRILQPCWVASQTPGTRNKQLWLLPSGPDQIHHLAMRGSIPADDRLLQFDYCIICARKAVREDSNLLRISYFGYISKLLCHTD